ncbi:sigma-70 family RNA polymerase sigma factor [Desulfosporosinus sp. PR]|uniref:RNA polymerase sigma factor n=1 Tax=Candidatus Desulfosporosinus nitrosoreducens TaxID=3401928 RepID=UPI0027EAED17|nr:sigma-70 family RNA polymerase sigma factor [Desulfosporosinus sp. PR]MDQ7095705.1 sigma-70 family RNA polymerase sigma factor [Desulfosporosinus sp. PR]
MGDEIVREIAEKMFNEHANFVYRTAFFLTKSTELADDITQETFIQVFRKYNTYDPSKPLQPWIYKIAVNITRNTLRKQKWLKFWGDLPENRSTEFMENYILKSEEERELWKAVTNLNLKSREIIILHFYSGLKLNEIAVCLGIPLGTCKSRLNLALNKLRKSMVNNDFEFLLKGGSTFNASKL